MGVFLVGVGRVGDAGGFRRLAQFSVNIFTWREIWEGVYGIFGKSMKSGFQACVEYIWRQVEFQNNTNSGPNDGAVRGFRLTFQPFCTLYDVVKLKPALVTKGKLDGTD